MVSVIKLDYDTNYPQKVMSIDRIGYVFRFLRLNIEDVKVWRTKNGIHVRIWVKQKLSCLMVVMIQALCNSDYARECYNLVRVVNLLERPNQYGETAREQFNVLFYKKLVKGEVASEEKHDEKLSQKLWKELKS